MSVVAVALKEKKGHVLVFLPGVGEIMSCKEALESLAAKQVHAFLPFFCDLPAEHHFFFFQEEDGIRDLPVTGVQTCALPILEMGEAGWLTEWVTDPTGSSHGRQIS